MSTIKSYLDKIEHNYSVKVLEKTTFDVELGWNPLQVELKTPQVSVFKIKFGEFGEVNGVKYSIENNIACFNAKKGMSIEQILQIITVQQS
ncbi:hypothetical protein JF536_11550 [Priestia flexa]|uniref:hypothetical protein n=1 Tax=Priestia flexa TaxID=86664 RepID=UPI001A8DD1A2|nr:hypothetical protein [Priestia flexa]MBN8434731.1 hypothetical protein [Priestia flexa]MCA0967269.1 hypothetical protein [Priestia flexa]